MVSSNSVISASPAQCLPTLLCLLLSKVRLYIWLPNSSRNCHIITLLICGRSESSSMSSSLGHPHSTPTASIHWSIWSLKIRSNSQITCPRNSNRSYKVFSIRHQARGSHGPNYWRIPLSARPNRKRKTEKLDKSSITTGQPMSTILAANRIWMKFSMQRPKTRQAPHQVLTSWRTFSQISTCQTSSSTNIRY